MFVIQSEIKEINLKNNEFVMINGKLYVVGESFVNDNIMLTCVDKYKDEILSRLK